MRWPVSAPIVAVLLIGLVGCAPAAAPAPTAAPAKPAEAPKPAASPAASPVAAASPAASPAPSPAASPAASPSPVAAAPAKPTAPLTPETVRLGMLSSASDSGLFIAIDKGYFKEQGVEISTTPFDSAAQMIGPLGTGQLDVGGGAPGAGLANALARGINIKITADKGTPALAGGQSYQQLLIRKELWDSNQVRGPDGLKGRKVAIANLGGISPEVSLQRALEQANLGTKDVELVALPFPDMVPALANGSIDAAIVIEPFVTTAVERGVAVKWTDQAQWYREQQIAVLLYAQEFIQQKPDLARRFMVAYVKALRDYNDAFAKKDPAKRQEIIPILTKYTTLKDPALYEKVAMPGLHPDARVNKESLKSDQAYYIQVGKQQAPINIDELVEEQFIEAAIRQLGPYR